MNTLSFDLLKLIDNRLEAKCSCLLGLSTGTELFLSGYDQFNITQTKWFLQFASSRFSIWMSDELIKILDFETIKFIHSNYQGESYGTARALIHKMIENGNFVPYPQDYTQCDHDIHDLCQEIEVAIKYNKTKIVKQLVNVVLGFKDGIATRYNYDPDDSIYARHGDPGPSEDEPYYVITYLLTEAYKYNNHELIIYFEELYNKLDVSDLHDKYYILIGLLKYPETNTKRIIPLLEDLRTDKIIFDKVFRGALEYCNKEAIDLLLRYYDGNTRKDKLKNIGKYARDHHLYGYSCDDEFHELYRFALYGSNTEIAHNIYEIVLEFALAKVEKLELYDEFDVGNVFVFDAIIIERFELVDMIIKNWKSEWIQLFNNKYVFNGYKLSVSIFDYLRSRFGYQFNLNKLLVNSWAGSDYKLFKRVCDILDE